MENTIIIKKNGRYVQVLSEGWEPKNEAMRQAWKVIDDQVEEARQQVLAGKFSPVFYFMEKNQMNIKLLAEYAGIPKRKVKSHLKPSTFQKLDKETLERYAEAFNITPDRLLNFNEVRVVHGK